jgi:hypothetical protein
MNIHSNDNQYLSHDDAKKLLHYVQVDFGNLKVGDHFRYTSNKYQQAGRKLSYGVVKSKNDDSITVNGYNPNPEEEPMYPDWTIKYPDRNKKYNFYKKEPKVCDACEHEGVHSCNCTKIKSYNC